MKTGAQLYTVRSFTQTPDGLSETLRRVADIGYKSVQISGTCPFDAEWLDAELKKNGLECAVTHTPEQRLLSDAEAVAKEHLIFGCKYCGLGWNAFKLDSGDTHYADRDIDRRELRSYVSKGRKVPGMNINAKDAVELVRAGAGHARIELEQDETETLSRNVVLDLPGRREEYILFTAHYDSTSLSQGAYDNMTGSVGLLAMAEHFARAPHDYGMRFVWCGSEERGLLGSKAYAAAHEEELKKCALNINLDMIGSIMGKFIACVTGEEKLVHYIEYMAAELGWGIEARQGVYSSDSTPLADKGVPAVSFARLAPHNTATIHNRYDTADLLLAERMEADIGFIQTFAGRMANAALCPVGREMPENMKEKLDYYLLRKREKK